MVARSIVWRGCKDLLVLGVLKLGRPFLVFIHFPRRFSRIKRRFDELE